MEEDLPCDESWFENNISVVFSVTFVEFCSFHIMFIKCLMYFIEEIIDISLIFQNTKIPSS